MQLRLLVETAAKALLVDHEMKFRSDVFTGVEELEKSLRREEATSACATSTSRVLRKLSELKLVDEETAEEAVKLWNKLSVEWAHFRGAFIRTRKALERFGDLPSFRYVLPAELGEEDAGDLKELAECVARARRLLRTFYSSWRALPDGAVPMPDGAPLPQCRGLERGRDRQPRPEGAAREGAQAHAEACR
jgi:hypothetical protein